MRTNPYGLFSNLPKRFVKMSLNKSDRTSVYLTKINPGKAIPSFTQKGIANQGPGVVGEVPVIVNAIHVLLSVSFFRYIINTIVTRLPYQVHSSVQFNFFKRITVLARLFEVPPCTFRFISLTPSEVAQLKGMGLQQDLTNTNLFVGSPPAHHLAEINALRPVTDHVRPGHLNFEAFFAWIYLMKGIQIFTTAKRVLISNGMNITYKPEEAVAKGENGSLRGINGGAVKIVKADLDVIPCTGRIVLAPPDKDYSSLQGCFSEVSDGPKFGNGIFFPFFNGMNTADKTTSYSVFARIFAGCLSTEAENESVLMNRIRAGARQLSFSRSGMVLAHIYRCFDISNDVPSSTVTILTKGNTYVGCVVEGEFSVTMYGTQYTAGDVSEEVGRVDLLASQCQEVCSKINSYEDSDGDKPFNFKSSDFATSRMALHSFNSINQALFTDATIEEVIEILEKIEYNDEYPAITQDTILKAVRYMSTGQFSEIAGYPAYLGGGVLKNKDRIYEALSMFGPRVPTCNYGDKGSLFFNFPAVGKQDMNTVKEKGVRPLHYFPFKEKPIGVAAVEWSNMISKGMIAIEKGRKGRKEFTNLHSTVTTIGTDPHFTEMYELLKGMANDARSAGEQSGKRKRGRDDDNEGGNKRAKTVAADLDI